MGAKEEYLRIVDLQAYVFSKNTVPFTNSSKSFLFKKHYFF